MPEWTETLEVFCADIGSIPNGSFAWARRHPGEADEEVHAPGSIEALANAVAYQLTRGRPVALGLEAPLFVPVPQAAAELGKARPCDAGMPAWSSNVGASVMATGIVQAAWVLERVRGHCPGAALHLTWDALAEARQGLLVWEAFVSGDAKGETHEEDAKIGVRAFCDQLPTPGDATAHEVKRPLSLAAAVAIWAGWDLEPAAVRSPCLLVRAQA